MTRISTNPTDVAIAHHLAAMPHSRYELGLFDAEAERMSLRRWDFDTLQRSVGYLKAQNMQGRHIYIRPEGPHPYSLIDDLTPAGVTDLKAAGFTPALVVETSPNNCQAWLNHGRDLPPALSTAVAKDLAQRFGGDPSSADWRHFGRLAGFTNRKPKYQRPDGRYPFVQIVEASGALCPESPALIEQAAARLAQERAAEEARRQSFAAAPSTNLERGIEDFRNSASYGGDHHRADLAFATYAISRGQSPAAIEAAIRSRDLSHKGGEARQRDYVERTIQKARQAVDNAPRR